MADDAGPKAAEEEEEVFPAEMEPFKQVRRVASATRAPDVKCCCRKETMP
jgi:hypothetical protein